MHLSNVNNFFSSFQNIKKSIKITAKRVFFSHLISCRANFILSFLYDSSFYSWSLIAIIVCHEEFYGAAILFYSSDFFFLCLFWLKTFFVSQSIQVEFISLFWNFMHGVCLVGHSHFLFLVRMFYSKGEIVNFLFRLN